MNGSVIRLLYQGLPPLKDHIPVAQPFFPGALAFSPLALPGSAGQADDETAWRACEKNGIRWLEQDIGHFPAPVYISGPSTSSLDVARILAEAGLFPEWASVLSLKQSAGRGQMRRAWSSPEGNIYAAIRLPCASPFDTAAAAPACGALLAEALHQEGCPVMLKWPNDILQAGESFRTGVMPGRDDCHKVGGMLLEERNGVLTAGIGLNITSCPDSSTLRDNYAFSAGTLTLADGTPFSAAFKENGKKNNNIVTIFTLWERLAGSIFSCYAKAEPLGKWWSALAEKHLAFRGCRVTLADACPEKEGMVRIPSEGVVDGVTESGALRLITAYGMETFVGGSLLPAERSQKEPSESVSLSE